MPTNGPEVLMMPKDSGHNLRSRSNVSKAELNTDPKAKQLKSKTSLSGSSTLNKSSRQSTSSAGSSARVSTPISDKVKESLQALESRISALESTVERLSTENQDLRQSVVSLQSELEQCRNQLGRQVSINSSECNTSLDQQEINTNIVIRGVEISESHTEGDLRAVYEGLRDHLDSSDIEELAPVSVELLPSRSTNRCNRPIRVQLKTVAAKERFLQIRRVKKDILPSDIGISSTSRSPILITEQLTRANQELLYKARSLRGQNKFKFVWSSNGQILARQRENAKVIRILDEDHVNRIRAELQLDPLPTNGRLYTTTVAQSGSNDSQI